MGSTLEADSGKEDSVAAVESQMAPASVDEEVSVQPLVPDHEKQEIKASTPKPNFRSLPENLTTLCPTHNLTLVKSFGF